MAFFRPMGADSVAYHELTVLERGDDHPGQALDYYGSRGETPLRWGGDLAPLLGLAGEVTPDEYRAAFGPGGFRLPTMEEQLTRVKRPGFEWVIGPHKSVALLGVIGRAEDMHAILDAERNASLGFVEAEWKRYGGTRGREQTRTPTAGLLWAVTRHGTTRAGDPHPHDHILFVNLTYMLDAKGGWKALDSALLRDMTEAATMVGRMAAAYKAIELGYRIEIDQGTSGRARRWRIVGIPDEVCELFSKRADDIARYLEERGQSSYRARNIAARATREVKRHTGVDELMPQWIAELEAIGWSVDRLAAALDAAREASAGLLAPLTGAEIDAITGSLMDPESTFHTRRKVFNRLHLIQEIAPLLYGHDPDELWRVLDQVIASELVVPLIGGPYSRERTYASALVLAAEQTIAERIDTLAARPGPTIDRRAIHDAITAKAHQVGRPLTAGQAAAVARTLGAEAGIEARTTRSLLWRLDHGQLQLDERTVILLDEAAMTADADLARILQAATRRHATVVLVGDPRQLAPVGPGGALAATLTAHPEIVTVMAHNVRQRDPGERAALAEVRHGDPDTALAWYMENQRIRAETDQLHALYRMVDAWATDTAAGHDTLMLAWRRDTVAQLNLFARAAAERAGWITGDDLTAPGGRRYATGDRVVTLAPNYQGDLVTSQRAQVIDIDHHAQTLTLRTDDHRTAHLTGDQLDAQHLAHGYAVTTHRAQGATADRAHLLAEGGGRELAYVALSRARDHTTIWTVADDHDQATEHLAYDWSQTLAQDWVSLTHQPDPTPKPDRQITDALDAALDDLEAANAALDARDRTLARLDAIQHAPAPEPERDLGRDFGF